MTQGHSLGPLARLAGYANVAKGVRRIQGFEREGAGPIEPFLKVAEALRLDLATISELAKADRWELRAEWEKFADMPVPIRLVVRLMPAVYATVPLPEGNLSREELEEFASKVARERRAMARLELSRRKRSVIDENGRVTREMIGYINYGGPWGIRALRRLLCMQRLD